MKPSQLLETLKVVIPAHLPILIKGAPGVGKSDVVRQAAEACEADFILCHPAIEDPTDPKGLPAIVKGKAEFLPFGNLRKMIEAKRLTVVNVDDLGQAPNAMQAAYMQLILARQAGDHRVGDKVVFIACTNRKEDRAGVSGILEPVKSRFASILELTPDVDDWCLWALNHDVPAEVVAFIRFRPELLLDTDRPTNDIVNRPSPRTVTYMGRLFALGLRGVEVLAGAVGQGFAAEFVGFLRVWESLPSLDAILMEPMNAKVPSEPAALFAVAVGLAQRANSANAERLMRYATRLPEEFGVLCIRDALRACPTAANSPTFIKWVASHQNVLV